MFNIGQLQAAQSLPASKVTTAISSPSLGLFLSAEPSRSPPPRNEVDDYLSVHGRPQSTRKHHRKASTFYANSVLAENSTPAGHSSFFTPQAIGKGNQEVEGHDCDSNLCCNSDVQTMKGNDSFGLPAPEQTTSNGPSAEPSRPELYSPPAALSTSIDGKDSPAANSLRSLGNRRESWSGRQMSAALTRALSFLKAEAPETNTGLSTNSLQQEQETLIPERHPQRRRITIRDVEHPRYEHRASKGAAGMFTPSSITLRKASDANASLPPYLRSSMTASIGQEHSQIRSSYPPSAELLAFYSTTFTTIEGLIPFTSSSNDISLPLGKLMQGSRLDKESPPPSKGVFSLPAKIIDARRSSTLAANALTFTDVHIAPGTFVVEPKSRKQSFASLQEPPRRVSVVQFQARNSIHEVIWREDETTSNSSLATTSRTSSSPPNNRDSPQSGKRSPEAAKIQSQKPLKPADPSQTVSSLNTELPKAGLFQWSWRKSPSPPSTTPASDSSPRAELLKRELASRPRTERYASISNPDPIRIDTEDDLRPGLTAEKRSVSEVQDILSFPSLRDRRSTLEWRKGSLVNLNGPSIGRAGDANTQVEHISQGSVGNGQEISPLKRLGSGLGSSSRMRILHKTT